MSSDEYLARLGPPPSSASLTDISHRDGDVSTLDRIAQVSVEVCEVAHVAKKLSGVEA